MRLETVHKGQHSGLFHLCDVLLSQWHPAHGTLHPPAFGGGRPTVRILQTGCVPLLLSQLSGSFSMHALFQDGRSRVTVHLVSRDTQEPSSQDMNLSVKPKWITSCELVEDH